MYRIIIADDEDMIRKSLSSMIDWSALGFQIVGNFADGQEVIDYLEYMEADVIMTDIKMTCASGLDIARYVHENHCPCKMIFIIAHQEFDLALQGIRYGVKDYLLKPAGIETIRKTFVHMKELLDAEAGSRSREASVARLADLLPELRSQLFSDVVLGVLQNADYIANRLEVLYPNSRLEQAPCVVVDAWIQDYPHFMKNVWDGSKDDFQDRMRT
ncbi:MAG: response regulator, partial [Ruthenibacterium sp.]